MGQKSNIACLGDLTRSCLKAEVKGRAAFLSGDTREGSASKRLRVVHIRFLAIVELRCSCPCGLSAGGHAGLLNANHVPLPGGAKSFLRTRSGQTGIISLS